MLSILVAPIASVILGACGCTPAPVPTSPPQTTSPPIVTVTSGLPAGWVDVGENVGYGNSIAHVHESYLGSSGHRLNMLKRTFDQVGAGVATARCSGSTRVFTVLVFVDFG